MRSSIKFYSASNGCPPQPQAVLVLALLRAPISILFARLTHGARVQTLNAAAARGKLTTEVISSIKPIKLYTWENPYASRINNLREVELTSARRMMLADMLNQVLFYVAPTLYAAVMFGVYAARGGILTPQVAFPALLLMNGIRMPIY